MHEYVRSILGLIILRFGRFCYSLWTIAAESEARPAVDVAPNVDVAAPVPKSDVVAPNGAVVAGLAPNKLVPDEG